MEIITGTVEWDEAEDRQIWRQFLDTRTGKRLFPKALESVPTLCPKGEVNEILIRSGEVRGFQLLTQALLSLAFGDPAEKLPPTEESYPDLADDAKWADGQKLNP